MEQIPHGVYESVDTTELESRMQAVNWQEHPGHFKYNEDDPHNPQLAEMRNIEKQLDRLCRMEQNEPVVVWEHLMVKYFKSTPLEMAICETVPYLTQSFKNEQYLNSNNMNTENIEYLKKSLLNLGFGEKVNEEMEKLIKAKVPEFNLTTEQTYNNKKMDYTLHFKAGDQGDMYFFNRYDASLKNETDPTKDRMQTLYINKGHGITAKEAFNLMEGRSVEKRLYNKENEPYTAWLKLDFKERDDYGNHKLQKFSEKYGYDLEKTLAQYPIKQLADPQQKEELMRSLKKGNAQQVTIEKDDQSHKYYLVAEPQYKQINVYDQSMKTVKRESLKLDNTQQKTQKNQQENTNKQSRKQKVH
jgi:hypothetical protein